MAMIGQKFINSGSCFLQDVEPLEFGLKCIIFRTGLNPIQAII